jgi:hypothetical protein
MIEMQGYPSSSWLTRTGHPPRNYGFDPSQPSVRKRTPTAPRLAV